MMDTHVLRGITEAACTRMRGKLWPNQIGFNRNGWQICYSERAAKWHAGRRLRNGRIRYAYRTTPEAALQAVRTKGQYIEEAV
jgi:hypothetical protein